MAQPLYRLTISRKDGKEITFTDYKNETVTKKHCPIGVIFPSRLREGGLDLKIEKKVTIDPEVFYVNVFAVEPKGESEEKPKSRKPGRKPAPANNEPEADPFAE